MGVLLIITYRSEFEPPWVGRPYVTALTVNRLPHRQIAAMIDRITGNKALPASIKQDIVERTDGIPLFIEEMTKAVLEADGALFAEMLSLPNDGRYPVTEPLPQQRRQRTLEALITQIMSRFQTSGINPMDVLEHHQHRTLLG